MPPYDSGSTVPDWAGDVLELVAQRFGYRVASENVQRVLDAVQAVRRDAGFAHEGAAVKLLRSLPMDAPLLQLFLGRVMRSENAFFAEASTLRSLREELLPKVIAACAPQRVVRVWSAGCGGGEEVYTLGILLRELIPDHASWRFILAATDVSLEVAQEARQGVYEPTSLRWASPEDRARCFESLPGPLFRLRDAYKEGVTFMTHNLADPAAPSPAPGCFDLIVCRDLLHAFTPEAQQAATACFLGALAPHGVWVAAPTDPLPTEGFVARRAPGLVWHGLAAAFAATASGHFTSIAPSVSAPEEKPAGRPRRHMVTRPLRAPTVPEATRAPSQPPRVASLDYAGAARLAEVRDMLDAESLDLARHKLAELLHLYPMVPSIYVMRAMLLDAEGDPASAEQELTRALYLDPLHLEAQLRLGLVLLRLGRVERGKHVLRRAVCMPDSGRTDVEDMRLDAAQRLVALIEQETAARAQAR